VRKGMLGVLFLSFGIASVAAADPVVLMSGSFVVEPDSAGNTFMGSGRAFDGGGPGVGGDFARAFSIGDFASPSRGFRFARVAEPPGFAKSAAVTPEGHSSRGDHSNTSPSVVGPASHAPTTPAAMTTVLPVLDDAGHRTLFTPQVTTAATVSIALKDMGIGHVAADPPLLTAVGLASTPSATPEPATLLLLATGVVPLVLRRRRQH